MSAGGSGGEELEAVSTEAVPNAALLDDVDVLLDEEDTDVAGLVAELIRYYVLCGAPSHRAEEKAGRLFRALNIAGTVQCIPNGQTFTFDQKRIIVFSAEEPSLSLRGVEDVESVVKKTRQNSACFAREAKAVLAKQKEAFHPVLQFAARAISPPMAVAVFFGGTFVDMGAAFVIGLVLAVLSFLIRLTNFGPLERTFDRIFGVVAGIIVAVLARTFSYFSLVEHSCNRAVQLSVVVDLLPGVSITLSVLELAASRSVSGTVRLFSALLSAFLIGFGLAYGNLIASAWSSPLPLNPVCTNPNANLMISTWWTLLFLPIQLCGYAIQLNAPLLRWPAMFLAGTVSWAVTFGFTFVKSGGVEAMGTVAAAFAVGCVGGLAEKITRNRTSSMSPILEGILILVPGSIAVLSIANAVEQNVSNGIAFGVRFITVAVSITVGLFLAGVLFVIPWRGRAKRLDAEDSVKYLL